ncbi:MAG: hypothetical protein KDB60_08485 [Propionibacteriaceae bacterium]|nr:hypothetical protein [Propionibacteriaceae bacterium]
MTDAANRTARILATLSLSLVLAGGGLSSPVAAHAAGAGSTVGTPDLVGRSAATSVTRVTTIVTQPANLAISRYGTRTKGSFTVVASGLKLTYKWQRRPASGGVWKTITGARSASYTVRVGTWPSGTRFRVKVSGTGGTVTSRVARLTVLKPTKTPAKDAEKAFGLTGLTQGVDLSAYQYLPSGRIKMAKVAERVGTDGFTILRNGSGARPRKVAYTDACTGQAMRTGAKPVVEDCAYATFADQATSAGLSLGHYWFNGWIDSIDTTSQDLFAGGFTPEDSAATFVSWLKADGNYTKKSTDPLVLDVEAGHAWTKKKDGKKYTLTLRAWNPAEATAFITEVKALLTADGYHPNLYVYMSANAASKKVNGVYRWADVAPIARLWVASWGTDNGRIPDSQPKVGPWASHGGWSLWQYSSNARIAGSGVGALDGDIAKADAWTPNA